MSSIHWAWSTCLTLSLASLFFAISFSPGNCSKNQYSEHDPSTIRAKGELVDKQIKLEKLRIDKPRSQYPCIGDGKHKHISPSGICQSCGIVVVKQRPNRIVTDREKCRDGDGHHVNESGFCMNCGAKVR